jgi:hypothetical protein
VEKLEQSLESFDSEPVQPDVPLILRKAERDALTSQLDDLRAQLRDYQSPREVS